MGDGAEIVKGQTRIFPTGSTFIAKLFSLFLLKLPGVQRFSALTCLILVATMGVKMQHGGRPPGLRLPGHMGFVRVTVQNLTVVKVDTENNLIAVKGAVPGTKGTIVTLANSVKA